MPRDTISSWILKYKKYNDSPAGIDEESTTFLNITKHVNAPLNALKEGLNAEISLSINGFAIKADLSTIKRILIGDHNNV